VPSAVVTAYNLLLPCKQVSVCWDSSRNIANKFVSFMFSPFCVVIQATANYVLRIGSAINGSVYAGILYRQYLQYSAESAVFFKEPC
jgi:hypothetical protein